MKLNIGDFVWICKKKDLSFSHQIQQRRLTISRSDQTLILPYVVERKRADDLASSIKDGRFHEQKHRLEKCLLQPIYLMETYGNGDWGLTEGALTQALANTQITNNFLIQQTSSIKDTCAYLTHMTRLFSKMYSVSSAILFFTSKGLNTVSIELRTIFFLGLEQKNFKLSSRRMAKPKNIKRRVFNQF